MRALLLLFLVLPSSTTATQAPGIQLEYVERLLGGARADQTLPMIIAVHGLGDRPEAFGRLFDGFPMPARLILPRGRFPYGRGHSWFAIERPPGPKMIGQMQGSAAALATLAHRLAKERPTLGKPVITGFSQGGMLSYAIAVQYPQFFAASVPISGLLPKEMWPISPVKIPVVAFHGAADDRVPVAAARQTVSHLKGDVRLHEFPGVRHRIPVPVRRAVFDALATQLPTR